jgi:5-methylcytosine-specific restriction endonuclease McrBC regulatory subunit McrC
MKPLKDNSIVRVSNLSQEQYEDLRWIADCPLKDLVDKDLNNVWLFPKPEDRYNDKIDDDQILSIRRSKEGFDLTTFNIMGYVGYGDTELKIESRFSNNEHDWFMQYMLQKVFSINIFDLKHSSNKVGTLDITPLLFPYFLQKAMRQGVYKEYRRCHYNDSQVKGAIEFNEHIKANYPFKNGKIAYSTREFIYDNSITELIRHTIEFIKRQDSFADVLHCSGEVQSYVKQIIEATPSYSRGSLGRIMKENLKPKIHPYFSEYLPLQKLCLHILKHEQLGYGKEQDKIHGVLFDGAWLWEAYLAQLMEGAGYEHPDNKEKTGAIPSFSELPKKYLRYPDFMKDNVIADAKYKNMLKPVPTSRHYYEYIQRDDLHQMIAYMHITSSSTGVLICPTSLSVMDIETGEFTENFDLAFRRDELTVCKVGSLSGDGGVIQIIGVNIPAAVNSYEEFVSKMSCIEKQLVRYMEALS